MTLLAVQTHRDLVGHFESGQADIDLLHDISTALIAEQDPMALYAKIVEAAMSITRSQFGTMQVLCPHDDLSGNGGKLGLLCARGLPEEALTFWQWVSPEAFSSCTKALKSGRREVIPDYEEWDAIANTEDLLAFRGAGIRAAQTTPLFSRDGHLLGMISTHWREPHTPSERDLRLLDILARQAADLLERTIAEEARREREQELDRTCAALRETEAMQVHLNGELSHRVMNMLATVQAIASQTLRHCDDPVDFVKNFSGRIHSMSRVHSQLSTHEWKGMQLCDIICDQMNFGPVDKAQISASGPPVYLDASSVSKMAMIIHELGTNSLKYGALSKPEGRVTIAWAGNGQELEMRWTENGGPPVAATVRRGFGTKLIESSAAGAGGVAKMLIGSDGVEWIIVLPHVMNPSEVLAAPSPLVVEELSANHISADLDDRVGLKRLGGKRILVVEDEPLLAMDTVGLLEDAGACVIGPVGTVPAAVSLIERYRFHGALLDANLDGNPIDDVAAALVHNNIPFIFLSGYNRASLPKAFEAAELISKPFDANILLSAVAKLVA